MKINVKIIRGKEKPKKIWIETILKKYDSC